MQSASSPEDGEQKRQCHQAVSPREEQVRVSSQKKRNSFAVCKLNSWCTGRYYKARPEVSSVQVHAEVLSTPLPVGGKISQEVSQNLFLQGTPHLAYPFPHPELCFKHEITSCYERGSFQPLMKYLFCSINITVYFLVSPAN